MKRICSSVTNSGLFLMILAIPHEILGAANPGVYMTGPATSILPSTIEGQCQVPLAVNAPRCRIQHHSVASQVSFYSRKPGSQDQIPMPLKLVGKEILQCPEKTRII